MPIRRLFYMRSYRKKVLFKLTRLKNYKNIRRCALKYPYDPSKSFYPLTSNYIWMNQPSFKGGVRWNLWVVFKFFRAPKRGYKSIRKTKILPFQEKFFFTPIWLVSLLFSYYWLRRIFRNTYNLEKSFGSERIFLKRVVTRSHWDLRFNKYGWRSAVWKSARDHFWYSGGNHSNVFMDMFAPDFKDFDECFKLWQSYALESDHPWLVTAESNVYKTSHGWTSWNFSEEEFTTHEFDWYAYRHFFHEGECVLTTPHTELFFIWNLFPDNAYPIDWWFWIFPIY